MEELTTKYINDSLTKLVKKNWLTEEQKNDFIKHFKNETKDKLEFTSPNKDDVFNAFKIGENDCIIKPEDIRVLILGQDPYPSKGKNAGRSHGLAFSFGPKAENRKADDSLLNIFKAIQKYNNSEKDIKYWNTNLKNWAKNNQVLLLNTALTYECNNQKTKHQNAWKPFIKNIITNLLTCNYGELVVFLWGDDARKLFHEIIYYDGKDIDKKRDLTESVNRNLLVLATSHPTENHNAYKKGFCYEAPNHFKACDEFLFENDEEKYIWKNFPENNK